MWFFFGILLGSSMGSDDIITRQLQQIPLRCLYAFEISEKSYKTCRYPSMFKELYGYKGWPCSGREVQGSKNANCSVTFHLELEYNALKELKKEVEKKKNDETSGTGR